MIFGRAWKDFITKNQSILTPSNIFSRSPPCSTVWVKTPNQKLLKILVLHEFSVFSMNSRFSKNRNGLFILYSEQKNPFK